MTRERGALPGPTWITRAVVGIVLATFFSDVGHEMATATLPMYLGSIGLGAAALGFMEGLADLLFSSSKLLGGWVGHHTEKKRAFASLGYLATALGTVAIALTQSLAALISVRSAAWLGRGFRSPLRDFMLADEVGPTHFGRAYGIERAADMLGAVAGPLLAALLLWLGVDLRSVILASLVPSLLAVTSFFSMTRDKPVQAVASNEKKAAQRLPRRFWVFVAGVALFGVGDSLFDAAGKPVRGDMTPQLFLWDAGTEVNEEPGLGPNQGPRQKTPTAGVTEHKAVAHVSDGFTYPHTAEVLRLTIAPAGEAVSSK